MVQRLLATARTRLVVIESQALLIDAARLLKEPEVNLVVVSDEAGKMAGVITKTDVVGRISQCTGCSCTMAAADVMTTEVAVCCPDDRLNDVWTTIKAQGLKNVPVIDRDSRPLGVLSARVVLQTLLEETEYEERLLRDYVMCVGYH